MPRSRKIEKWSGDTQDTEDEQPDDCMEEEESSDDELLHVVEDLLVLLKEWFTAWQRRSIPSPPEVKH